MASEKQKAKLANQRLELRQQIWGKIDEAILWSRKTHDGYSTIPRTMPLICSLVDEITGQRCSGVYLSLWSRDMDISMIELPNEKELATEAGYTGERAVSTWRKRIKALHTARFIDIKPGPYGDFSYALIFNPHKVIWAHHKQKAIMTQDFYYALVQRAIKIGAGSDFEEPKEKK